MKNETKPLDDIFVVGTDTGVGKTVVSLLLMQLLFARGYRPFYLKPFQTGCRDAQDRESDARFVYRYTEALKAQDPAQSVIYCLPNPKAPFFAARDAGQRIGLKSVSDMVSQMRQSHSPLLLEAAGGLMVPVTPKLLVIDVVQALDCRPLLVARAGLGTINHSLLSMEALRARGIEPLGVVLVDPDAQTTDTGLIQENASSIESYGRVKVGGVIGPIANFATPKADAYRPLERLIFTDA